MLNKWKLQVKISTCEKKKMTFLFSDFETNIGGIETVEKKVFLGHPNMHSLKSLIKSNKHFFDGGSQQIFF